MANASPVTTYLIFYNFMQFAGWGSALILCLRSLQDAGGYAQTYQKAGQTVGRRCNNQKAAELLCTYRLSIFVCATGRFQLLSAFEILHALTGALTSLRRL